MVTVLKELILEIILKKLNNIVKVTSGSNIDTIANVVDDLYKKIIDAGTFKAPSIRGCRGMQKL